MVNGLPKVVGGSQQLLKSYQNYNTQHLPQTVTDAAGQSTVYTYTVDGDVETVTRTRNGAQEVTTYTYVTDPNTPGYGSVQTITGPVAGATITYTYDSFGRVRTVTNSDGYTVTYTYDALNRLTKLEYPDGTNEQTVYNRLDPEWTSDRLGRWTHRAYNALRHPTDVYDPMNQHTHYDYCTCGALEGITDPNGNTTTFFSDLQSRVTSKVYNDGKATSFAYDPKINRLISKTDALNQVTHYAYYLDNNLQSVSYTNLAGAALTPPTPSVNYTYDPDFNRIATMTDGVGTTNYAYNPITSSPALGAGKLYSISGPLANSTITFGYDEYGRVVSQSVAGQASSVVYDALGRVISGANPLCTGSSTFGYDYVGVTSRLNHVYYPNGQTEERSYFGHLGDNRLQQIKHLPTSGSTAISQFDYTYDAVGNILTWAQANTGQTQGAAQYGFDYDKANQLTGAAVKQVGGALLHQFGYVYDPAGNRLGEQVDGSVNGGTFNGLNQLTSRAGGGHIVLEGTVSKPSTVSVGGSNVAVNAKSFKTKVNVNTGTNNISIVATDANNVSTSKTAQIVVTGTTSQEFSYDDNGNLLSDGSRTFTWDACNRLASITYADSTQTAFAYDGQNRRVQIKEISTSGTNTKNLLWVGNQIAEERDGNNSVTKRYFSQGMQVVSGSNAGSYFYTRDHLGSIRELMDGTGTLKTRYDYDPYGKRTATHVSGTDCNEADFGYTGHYQHAASGLNLTLYRAYDSETGRWLSRDPLKNAEMQQGPNLYEYVTNNPVGWVDPDGQGRNPSATKAVLDAAADILKDPEHPLNPYREGPMFPKELTDQWKKEWDDFWHPKKCPDNPPHIMSRDEIKDLQNKFRQMYPPSTSPVDWTFGWGSR